MDYILNIKLFSQLFSGNRLCSKTFKPRKNISDTNNNTTNNNTNNHHTTIGNNNNNNNDVIGKQNDLLPETAATLGSGDLRLAVRLPEGEDLHEWIAINTVDFFNQINMLYGTLLEFCTDDTCPIMSAGPKYEYHWADGQTVKKPLKCSAPHYIDCLMIWIQKQLENESIFPSKIGAPFPRDFINVVKVILKRLFRVYAHIYYQHFSEVRDLQEEAHLNTSFKHFIYFVLEFNLVQKRELVPLQHLIDLLTTNESTTNDEHNNNGSTSHNYSLRITTNDNNISSTINDN
uniref:Mps one binder kinase activator-like 1 (Mob1 homolog 1) (Mob1) n=1 Tax=Schistosoma mansoni TaxID=6183 RepID=A0A3Q0KHF4_SCHMA